MIELPEDRNVINQLNDALWGCIITDVIISQRSNPIVWCHDNPQSHLSLLIGQPIAFIKEYRETIHIQAGKAGLMFDKDAFLTLQNPQKEKCSKYHLLFKFDGAPSLSIYFPLYGIIRCCHNQQPADIHYTS